MVWESENIIENGEDVNSKEQPLEQLSDDAEVTYIYSWREQNYMSGQSG